MSMSFGDANMNAAESRKQSEKYSEIKKNKFFEFCLEKIAQQTFSGKTNATVDVESFEFADRAIKKLKSLDYKVSTKTCSYTGNKYIVISW